MNRGRVITITRKDIVLTTRESFFMFFIAFPLLATIVLNATLGSIGGTTPSLAYYGDEDVLMLLEGSQSVDVTNVSSLAELESAVREGRRDGGLVLDGTPKLLLSGSSQLNERATLLAVASQAIKESQGLPDVVDIERIVLPAEGYSLKTRLIPFLLIIATVVGGLIISASLIEEREQKTLDALLVSPATAGEVIVSKSLFGMFLGLVLGVLILLLNNSLSSALVIVSLVLGVGFTVGLGLMAGVVMDNITDLIARMKLFNIFLQFPALVILFPQIPQWVAKLFPTYYFVNPILEITQRGAGLGDVWWQWVVLLVCDIVVLILAARLLRERMLGKKITH
ncbi:MAG TPA: ABC transporter permease [Methanomicrobia archaeon]|nr:ABC transporter permease [Methanomicrobia archaeon]